MLLYLVYDTKNETVSYPLTAPSLEIAQASLYKLNPQNISDLIIHPLLTLNHPLDLFLLSIDTNKPLPSYIHRSGDSSPIADPTNEVR